MNLLIHLLIGMLLVVLQTTVLPAFCGEGFCYDLLIPFVVHLGHTFSMGRGFPLTVAFGLISDSLSGGPFGLYTTTYFWILVLIYWLLTFLHPRSSLIWPLIVALGALFQNGIILAILALTGQSLGISGILFSVVVPQFVLALLTGPLVLRFFHWLTLALTMLSRPGPAREEA